MPQAAIVPVMLAMSMAATGAQMYMANKNRPKMGNPKGLPSGGPAGPPADLTKDQLLAKKSSSYTTPGFLSLSGSMTPTQQRAAIASGGVSSDDPRYRDKETLSAYQQMLLNNYPSGEDGGLSDIEKQYITQIGGSPYAQTDESYLSALDRAVGKQ